MRRSAREGGLQGHIIIGTRNTNFERPCDKNNGNHNWQCLKVVKSLLIKEQKPGFDVHFLLRTGSKRLQQASCTFRFHRTDDRDSVFRNVNKNVSHFVSSCCHFIFQLAMKKNLSEHVKIKTASFNRIKTVHCDFT